VGAVLDQYPQAGYDQRGASLKTEPAASELRRT
jgi:hypothetical protein